jgi:hypothetical protein
MKFAISCKEPLEKASLFQSVLVMGCAIALIALLPQSARAQGCQIGFQSGTTIGDANINGNPANPPGKWADASTIQSGFPCLGYLYDWDKVTTMGGHAVPTLQKSVTVLSKRDASNLYLAFTVQDNTQNNGMQQLLVGEKIIIQIDPAHTFGTPAGNALGAGPGANQFDYRIELVHKWQQGTFFSKKFEVSNVAASPGCGVQDWGDTGSFPITAGLDDTGDIPGGYGIEVKIPLNQIGSPASDIGIAFAVVNDLGNVVNGYTDATGVTFPDSLKLQNGLGTAVDANDPATCAAAPANWLVPNSWGGGYFNTPPTDVTILQIPAWWNSQDIVGFECNVMGYDYYPGTPCKLTVQATLHNSSASASVRNLLFLWGDQDAGAVRWTFMDLQKGISVPAGGGPFSSAQFSPPAGLVNHPCVRVYILPATFRADFTEAMIRALNEADNSVIQDMETKYQLGTQHWAQKNITRETTGSVCPVANCNIGMRFPNPPDLPRSSANLFRLARFEEPALSAADTLEDAIESATQTAPGYTASQGDKHPPQIFMSKKELEAFGPQNVILQVRTFGYLKARVAKPPAYNLIEGIGGVLHLIPLEMINKGQVHFQFKVTNPGPNARTIVLVVDTLTPRNFGSVTVDIDRGPRDFGPGETKIIKGTVNKGTTGGGGPNKFAVFFDVGVAIPHGTFSNAFDPGVSFNAGLEYIFKPRFSIEGIFGAHHFSGKGVGDTTAIQFGGGGKVFLNPGHANMVFARAGIAGYHFTSPSTTNVGGYFGLGLLHQFNARFGLEGAYTFHVVNTPGSASQFSAIQVGARYVF